MGFEIIIYEIMTSSKVQFQWIIVVLKIKIKLEKKKLSREDVISNLFYRVFLRFSVPLVNHDYKNKPPRKMTVHHSIVLNYI